MSAAASCLTGAAVPIPVPQVHGAASGRLLRSHHPYLLFSRHRLWFLGQDTCPRPVVAYDWLRPARSRHTPEGLWLSPWLASPDSCLFLHSGHTDNLHCCMEKCQWLGCCIALNAIQPGGRGHRRMTWSRDRVLSASHSEGATGQSHGTRGSRHSSRCPGSSVRAPAGGLPCCTADAPALRGVRRAAGAEGAVFSRIRFIFQTHPTCHMATEPVLKFGLREEKPASPSLLKEVHEAVESGQLAGVAPGNAPSRT